MLTYSTALLYSSHQKTKNLNWTQTRPRYSSNTVFTGHVNGICTGYFFTSVACFYDDTCVANAKYTSGKSTNLEFLFFFAYGQILISVDVKLEKNVCNYSQCNLHNIFDYSDSSMN